MTWDEYGYEQDIQDKKIIPIEDRLSHVITEVICIKCGYRVISARPVSVLLKNLECVSCHKTGFIINTGQYIEDGVE